MITDKDEIIMYLKRELRNYKDSSFIVIYDDLDTTLDFPLGSVEKYLDEAADASGFDVTKGASRAELNRRPPRLVRG